MELDQLLAYLFRWIHMFAGVAWIGLLYYFNFVQTEYFKEAEAPAKASAIDKLVPRALWWFRFGALFTFLSGLALAGYLGGAVNFYITVGMVLGTLMFLNVWLIIWPNQKIVIASNAQVLAGNEAMSDAAAAQAKAGLASRTNTLFSMPMLFFMVASGHASPMANGGVWGGAGDMAMSTMALVIGLAIVVIVEANAIWGKMNGAIQSVSSVITSSVILTAIMAGVVYYL